MHDLATVAEFFAGDALCFATVVCLAAHLPHPLRAVALAEARHAVSRCGLPLSKPNDGEDEPLEHSPGKIATDSDIVGGVAEEVENDGEILEVKRYGAGHFVTGVLTNVMQLQGWVYPSVPTVEEHGDDSANESDDLNESPWKHGALPYHPAFMDAAVLTLSTPKWPLIVDPDGIALR